MSSKTIDFVLPLRSTTAEQGIPGLALAGGKGANLARLLRAGFPVPDGFVVATPAYHEFVRQAGLEAQIASALAQVDPADPTALETASACIRACFHEAAIPPAMEEAICAAYEKLGRPPVAVRSSATAEDLPDFSFAGQQDTFLNVNDPQSLLDAVRRCWSSLWTARAIGYRARNQIPSSGLALAVIVQEMVPSQASGVMFTAHPLTGQRNAIAIDAIYGLGEALVSGQSEPDQYVVRASAAGRPAEILSQTLGAKATIIQGRAEGGTESLHSPSPNQAALSGEQILALAELGQQVADEYGAPQDIEWGLADGQFFLLQSRAITSLYPTVDGIPSEPLRVFASFGAVQGILEPFTPLGRDFLRLLGTNVALWLGFKTSLASTLALRTAGERLFIHLTPLIRNRLGRRIVLAALKSIEPNIRAGVMRILDEPDLQPGKQSISMSGARNLLGFVVPTLFRMVGTLLRPDHRREQSFARVEAFLAETKSASAQVKTLAGLLNLIEDNLRRAPRFAARQLIPSFAPGVVMLNRMYHLAGDDPHNQRLILEATRGMPHNVTTLMDLELWQVACRLRSQPGLAEQFAARPARELADDYLQGRLPATAQQALTDFLKLYGMRGLAEIDLGRSRWREDPAPVIQALQSYLNIQDPAGAPDATFDRGRAHAEQAVLELADRVAAQAGGGLRGRIRRQQLLFAARRARALLGMRELPKFFAIRLMGFLRLALLENGRSLAQAGLLREPADIFFLFYPELRAIAGEQQADGGWPSAPAAGHPLLAGLTERVAARRQDYQREQQRRQVPVVLLSDGRAFYGGGNAQGDTFSGHEADGQGSQVTGTPVSPGRVEGRVRVVLDPHHAGLLPGEIMVCPGTDPSWTPLFLAAGGLVMEVGGLLTHGSVVAREYGIPAVVGVHAATQRLKTGQWICVDGTTGQITLLDEAVTKGDPT